MEIACGEARLVDVVERHGVVGVDGEHRVGADNWRNAQVDCIPMVYRKWVDRNVPSGAEFVAVLARRGSIDA